MNLNQLAKEVTKLEGGKINLSVAQVKEVLRCFGDVAYQAGDDLAFLELCSKLYVRAQKRAKEKTSKGR